VLVLSSSKSLRVFVSRALAVLVIDASDALIKFGNNMFAHVLHTQFWSEKVRFHLYCFF